MNEQILRTKLYISPLQAVSGTVPRRYALAEILDLQAERREGQRVPGTVLPNRAVTASLASRNS